MTRVFGFDENGYRRVQEATRRTLATARTGSQRRRQPPVLASLGLRDALLTSTLDAASDSLTGATTCTAVYLIPDPDNPGELMTGETFTLTNRSIDAEGGAGTYILVAPVNGETRLVWIDCAAGGS